MIIDTLLIGVIFVLTAVITHLAVGVGFYVGKRIRRKDDTEQDAPAAAIAAAILGVLSFMLAFIFGIVTDRFDDKKELVRQEANAIRTVWERSEFLQEPDRTKTFGLLRKYVDARLAFAQAGDPTNFEPKLAEARSLHHQMWEIAIANARTDPFMFSDIGSLYIDSINQLSALGALRVNRGLQARLPSGMWFALYCLLMLGMFAIGYQTAINDPRPSRATLILAVSFSVVLALIAALDHPMNSFIAIPQTPMVSLQTEMNGNSASQ